MNHTEQEKQMIQRAILGDQEALETLLCSVQDMVYNLSLRMLGMIPDAEDATQEILIKVMTRLVSFRRECSLRTWVFRIAANHLQNYRKGMFSARPLSFEAYGADIVSGREKDVPDMSGGVEEALLERELKLSCTNVMLQCLDPESRCIYILGTMFRLNSRIAAEISETTPEAYRQRLSRTRKKMAAFLQEYCGLSGTGSCACKQRIHYAIASHRIDPAHLSFQALQPCRYEDLLQCTDAMEQLDGMSQIFADLPAYHSSEKITAWVRNLLTSKNFSAVMKGREMA